MLTESQLSLCLTGKELAGEDREITYVSYDSRDVRKNSAFFCFKGTKSDGNRYIKDAINNGAILVVTNEEPRGFLPDVKFIVTNENIRTLYAIASSKFFSDPWKNAVVIGVTGTDGKTSTCDFICQLLRMEGIKAGLISTAYIDDGTGRKPNDTRMSTPEAFYLQKHLAKCVENGCAFIVIEATSHALSHEYDRLAGIKFTYSAYTEITSEHLEFHKTVERYIEAKARLSENTTGKVFIYDSNKALKEIKEKANAPVETLTAPDVVKQSLDGIVFSYEGKEYSLPFHERYQLENAFEAANLVSAALEKPLGDILPHLAYLRNVKSRGDMIENNRGISITIDFAHTPDAIGKVLQEWRVSHDSGRTITVFGASGDRDRSKRPFMGKAASEHSDVVILTEDDPRSEKVEDICGEIISGIEKPVELYVIPERMDAVKKALKIARRGDSVFFLGMGPEEYLDYGNGKKRYNEYKAVALALKELEDEDSPS